MATTKVKGTSRKIKELKGIKPEKITKDQLERVQKSVNDINRAQLEIGTLEVRKHEIIHSIAGVKEELTALQSEFEKEYGTFDVNIQDGTINYGDDGKADS